MSAPWELSRTAYQAGAGVHEPWICEISPMQMGNMTKRGKAQYEARRTREWQASADCKAEWERQVVAAFEAGEITRDTPGISDDARDALLWHGIRQSEAAAKAKLDAALDANHFKSLDDVEIGARVYDVMYGRYATVTRKFAKSVRLNDGAQEYTAQAVSGRGEVIRIQRQHYNDVAKDAA